MSLLLFTLIIFGRLFNEYKMNLNYILIEKMPEECKRKMGEKGRRESKNF